MTQPAIAFHAASFSPRNGSAPLPDLVETIAMITAAGRQITDLKVQLEAAERSIAALTIDKRTLEGELRSLRGAHPLRLAGAETPIPSPGRSHLDGALATIAQGLGPTLVRNP